MTGLEIFIVEIVKDVIKDLAKHGFKQVTKSNSNEYQRELSKVISATINDYRKKFYVEETDKIPFYVSQTLLEEFLKFRFTKKLEREKIKKAIDADKRIIPPNDVELKNFFEIFDKKLLESEKLKQLNVDINFKEEIFNISEFLRSYNDEIKNSLSEIKEIFHEKNVSIELQDEWNKQLDEIFEEIKSFKSFTAKQRLESLEVRINEQSIQSKNLFARLYYLKSECLNQIGTEETHEEQAKLIIKCYKLQPNNFDSKTRAVFAYYQLKEFETAQKLSDELLNHDEFNISGWVVRCYLADKEFENVLKVIPIAVKSKNLFKINLCHWLLARRYIKSFGDLRRLELSLNIDYDIKPSFSYKNMQYQHLLVTYLLGNFYEKNSSAPSQLKYDKASNSIEFNHAYEILKLSTENLIGTEIENTYYYYQFQYYCCSFILKQDEKFVAHMQIVFDKMKLKSIDVYLRMMQAYNSLNTREAFLKAIEVAEEYKGENIDSLQLFIAGNYGFINEKEKQTEAFIKFIQANLEIDRLFFLNFISFIRFSKVLVTEDLKNTIEHTLSEKLSTKQEYVQLLKVFCFINLKIGTYSNSEIDALIESAKKSADINDVSVSAEVAYSYCYNNEENKAKTYMRLFINKEQPSESLKLYCKTLFNSDGDKIELLEILEKWREIWEPDYELLQIEFELRRLQCKWDETIKISKVALKYFPDSDFFINGLFISLNNDMRFEDIKNEYSLLKKKIFQEHTAIIISKALLRAGLYEESIELLYQHAEKKENLQCRREYAVLFIKYPEDIFKRYEVVEIDTYVNYEINGSENILHITESNKDIDSNYLFLDKKLGESFSIPQKYSDVFIPVKILQVFNKYGALLHDLLKEAENPLSGHLLQSFKFKGESVEAMNETFIENFGVRGSLQKQNVEIRLEDYYNGKISFGEVTRFVFSGNFIDAYFILSDQNGKLFKSISTVISPTLNLNDEIKYALDFTSVCLFYQLSQERDFSFPKKFYISHLIRDKIIQELEEAKLNPKSDFSISITIEKVVPHFYDEHFNDRRINTFQTLLDWVNANCILVDVPERLNLIAGPQVKFNEPVLFMDILIDCRLLVDRENYVLLTNDVIYYRLLKGGINNIISPLHFLEKYHLEQNKNYINLMLKHNYVGIPITSSILNDQFYKMLSGSEDNRFSICLENLRYSWNPDYRHIRESIKFIKGLYVGSLIDKKIREQTTFAVFQNLLVGMEPRLVKMLMQLINTEFNLLAVQKINVLQLLALAVKSR
jgi:hypothetical protein